jgi:hypothetical protein
MIPQYVKPLLSFSHVMTIVMYTKGLAPLVAVKEESDETVHL